MKKIFIIFSLVFLTCGIYAFKAFEHTITSLLKQLELTEEEAKDHIWSNISYSNFYYPAPRELRNTPNSERAAIVKIVGEFVKAYTKTDDFASKFKEHMLSRKPEPPQKPETMGESKEKQRAELKRSISEMEASKKKLPADQQVIFESTIKLMKEQLKELDNPDNPMNSNANEADNYIQQGYQQQMKEYKEKLAKWEKEYNGSPDVLLEIWLKEFLDETKDIDFNAELKTEYGRKKFVKQEYEGKSQLWKLCFRAGKTTTEAARLFAQSWLKELK